MSLETAEEFDKYARDCVELAHQPNMPLEAREQLLQMAREWMRAAMAKHAVTSELDAASKPRRRAR